MEKSKLRPDYTTVAGPAVAVAGIIGGLVLENGHVQDLAQLAALLIVVGGTLGAVLASSSRSSLIRALRRGRGLFFEAQDDRSTVLNRLVYFAAMARRHGVVSMETEAERESDPFLRKALLLAVDGVDSHEIRRIMELELQQHEHSAAADARIFELAGGYAPTVGIIGAVLGLIQVMKHLDNVGELGRGIAVAFVATVYGVGLANLVLLPAGAKIRSRTEQQVRRCELIIQGTLAIVEGLNPRVIRMRLETFLDGQSATRAPGEPTAATTAATERIAS